MKQGKYDELRGRIRAKFRTQEAFAKALGINPTTLSIKLCGKRDWKREEVERAQKLLDIPPGEVSIYFF